MSLTRWNLSDMDSLASLVLCFSLVLNQVVALKLNCHMERQSGNWKYKLSHVPGGNCSDYWTSNGTSLADGDKVWKKVVVGKDVDYLVTNICLPLVRYRGDCEDHMKRLEATEAKCEGTCLQSTPAPTEAAVSATVSTYSKGHTHGHWQSHLMVPLCLGLTLFII